MPNLLHLPRLHREGKEAETAEIVSKTKPFRVPELETEATVDISSVDDLESYIQTRMYQHQPEFLHRVQDALEEVAKYRGFEFDELDPALAYESEPIFVDRIRLEPLGVVDLRYVMRLSMTEDRNYLVELAFAADSYCLPTRTADFEVTHQATLDKKEIDSIDKKVRKLADGFFGSGTRVNPDRLSERERMEDFQREYQKMIDEEPFLAFTENMIDRASGSTRGLQGPYTKLWNEYMKTKGIGGSEDDLYLSLVAYDLAVEMLTHLFYHPKGLAAPILQNSYLAALEQMGVAKVDEESRKQLTKRRRSEYIYT